MDCYQDRYSKDDAYFDRQKVRASHYRTLLVHHSLVNAGFLCALAHAQISTHPIRSQVTAIEQCLLGEPLRDEATIL